MKRNLEFWSVLIILALIAFATAHAQRYTQIKRPIDIKLGQRTIAVFDSNNSTITLLPGDGGVWVCAPHENGRTCKSAGEVVAWLLANGVEGQ